MKKKKTTKFFIIYDSLTSSEKQEFNSFLKLNIFSKPRISEKVINHFGSNIDPLKYLNSNFSQRSVWNICSELTKSLEHFLAVKELLGDKSKVDALARIYLHNRNLDTLLEHDYTNEIDRLLNSKITESTFREIAEAYDKLLPLLIKNKKSKLLREALAMRKNFRALSFFYQLILEMTDSHLTVISNEKQEDTLRDVVFPTVNFYEFLKIIKKKFPDYYDVFKMQYDIFILVSGKASLEFFYNTKKEFFDLSNRFSDKFNSVHFQLLVNFLIRMKNTKQFDVDTELFDLLSKKIEKGLINDLEDDKIGFNHFRDHVSIALNAGQVGWAENFVSEYSHLLPEQHKLNEINTANALISMVKGDFEKALEFIAKVKKNYYIQYNDFFRISIKANFELCNYNNCVVMSEKYRDYLRRTGKLSKEYVSGSMMFLKNIKRLVNYKYNSNEKYLEQIEFDLLKRIPQSESKWLNQKLNASLKRKSVKKAG